MPTVFVDRDGTLNVDLVRSVDVSRLRLMPRAAEAVRHWKDAGWQVLVVTNQSGIGRGLYTEAEMHAFHDALQDALAQEGGARVDGFAWCPHRPDEGCACRKPGHAMLERLGREHALDLRACFMVGDSWRDVAAAAAVGAHSVLVPSDDGDYDAACRTGMGRVVAPHHIAPDLLAAARWCTQRARGG